MALFEGLNSAEGTAGESREGNAWAWVKMAGLFLASTEHKSFTDVPRSHLLTSHLEISNTHTSSLTLRQ